MDGELLLGVYMFFTSYDNCEYLSKSKQPKGYLLFAFILVGSLQMVHFAECVKGFLDTILTEDIKTKIKDAIESVAVVVTFTTSHPRPQTSAKYFVDPCCFREFGINFSMAICIQDGASQK